jgi:SSS family solute:Na+ symporter
MPAADLVVFALYMIGVVVLGCWFARRNTSSDAFMAARHAVPGWAVGLSIFGTYLSSNTFIGVPGKAYGGNWNAFVFSLSIPVAAVLATRFFVPFYRRGGSISAYTHLEQRFGRWARTYTVICYLLTQLARMGAIMFGVAIALHALMGWDVAAIIIVTGVLVTFYTLVGGIEAVIWTDVVQAVVLTVGALLALALIVTRMPGGAAEAFEIAGNADKLSLGSLRVDFPTATVWTVLLYGVFINLTNFGIDQNYIQRYHTARTDRAAAASVWLGALVYVPVSALFFLIGSLLFSFYAAQPDLLASGGEQTADRVFPHFIATQMPAGLAGLIVAALAAAAMSSIDTSINSSATVLLTDVYTPYVRPDVDEAGRLRFLRRATVIWGAVATGVALAMIGVKSILDTWWLLSGVFAGGMLGLFLLGLIARRATNAAAITGVIVGVLVITWMTFSPQLSDDLEWLRSPFHANMITVIGTLVIFGVGVVVSAAGGRTPDERVA